LIKKAIIIMKKARVMLTAIAVLAVVGGALAFKAKTNFYKLYYNDSQSKCVLWDVTFHAKPVASGGTVFAGYSTTSDTQNACPGVATIIDN
jgi:type IV secretory pathway protease TraF